MDDWQDLAKCRGVDPEIFFPPGPGGSTEYAKFVCSGCPVREECLMLALKRAEPHGIWGGTTPEDRRSITRRAKREGAGLRAAAAWATQDRMIPR
jgi:WhiB family redox-sensing transcriptional regulator